MTAVAIDTPRPRPKPGDSFPPPWPGAPRHNQQATCPTCGDPVDSHLAACWKPRCLTADANFDARFDNQDDY